MSPIIVWSIIFAAIILFAWYATRMAGKGRRRGGGLDDAGFAILEFGRAFPNEAIRSLHSTLDGKAVFVRLYDNKAGIMRSHSRHFSCHLIKPGRVRVEGLPDASGFQAEFLDAPSNNGEFIFASQAEAAEVSLWLLGNYLPAAAQENGEEPI